MKRLYILFICLMLALTSAAPFAKAQNGQEDDNAPKVVISFDHPPYAVKGESFPLIITQNIIPHWHTYWINFGDSGEEMKINWTLPDGVEASGIIFPKPKRIYYDTLVNFGHEGSPQFIAGITVPETYESADLEVIANVKWLVCKEICIPEKQQVTFTIPVLAKQPDENEAASATYNEFAARFQKLKNDMPQHTDWTGHFYETDSALDEGEKVIGFHVELPNDIFAEIADDTKNLEFFPFDYGLTSHVKPQQVFLSQKEDKNFLTLILPKGDMEPENFKSYKILLLINDNGYYVDTLPKEAEKKTAPLSEAENTGQKQPQGSDTVTEAPEPATTQNNLSEITEHKVDPTRPEFEGLEARIHSLIVKFAPAGSDPFFVTFLIFAFLGGLILNLMPCVFPVLSMKALSVVKLADKSILRLWGNGIFYTLGVLFSFGAIATALLLLREGGSEIGWGFQLQNPNIVIILSWLIFTVGLNLSGIFHVSMGRAEGIGAGLATQPGLSGAFFTGMLATLVATPCTAAFMGTALGAAIVLPKIQALSIFLMLGFGLAFPYLVICLIPPLVRLLPRPGAWMETFRQFLAFPMYATAIWLVWVAVRQSGDIGLLYTLGGMLLLGFAVWLLRHSKNKHGQRNLFATVLALIFLILPFFLLAAYAPQTKQANADIVVSQASVREDNSAPIAFDENRLTDILQNLDNPVFVNMTASWCITCLYNERRTLSTDEVKDWMQRNDVIYMKGDWTNQDEHITRYLSSFGRNGVPLYVYYPAPDENNTRPAPVILPQILSTSQIIANHP
jgi:thiol:disulfide interchange protein DsbD